MTLYDGKLYDYDSPHLNVSKLDVSNIVFFVSLFSFLFFFSCFLSHDRPLLEASFHLSIFALCSVSSHTKRYFTNVLIDVGQTFYYFFFYRGSFSEVTEWHDWSLHDQWSVPKNVRNANITLNFPEATGILAEDNFRMPDHVDYSLQLKAFLFSSLPLFFHFKRAHNSWPNKEKRLTEYIIKVF